VIGVYSDYQPLTQLVSNVIAPRVHYLTLVLVRECNILHHIKKGWSPEGLLTNYPQRSAKLRRRESPFLLNLILSSPSGVG
jgi:hypothetical protein